MNTEIVIRIQHVLPCAKHSFQVEEPCLEREPYSPIDGESEESGEDQDLEQNALNVVPDGRAIESPPTPPPEMIRTDICHVPY